MGFQDLQEEIWECSCWGSKGLMPRVFKLWADITGWGIYPHRSILGCQDPPPTRGFREEKACGVSTWPGTLNLSPLQAAPGRPAPLGSNSPETQAFSTPFST